MLDVLDLRSSRSTPISARCNMIPAGKALQRAQESSKSLKMPMSRCAAKKRKVTKGLKSHERQRDIFQLISIVVKCASCP